MAQHVATRFSTFTDEQLQQLDPLDLVEDPDAEKELVIEQQHRGIA